MSSETVSMEDRLINAAQALDDIPENMVAVMFLEYIDFLGPANDIPERVEHNLTLYRPNMIMMLEELIKQFDPNY